MPTILRVYSNYQSNKMVVNVIEFIVKQLYILHRKPFVLQMLGSVASILDMDEAAIYGDANKVSICFLKYVLESQGTDYTQHMVGCYVFHHSHTALKTLISKV